MVPLPVPTIVADEPHSMSSISSWFTSAGVAVAPFVTAVPGDQSTQKCNSDRVRSAIGFTARLKKVVHVIRFLGRVCSASIGRRTRLVQIIIRRVPPG